MNLTELFKNVMAFIDEHISETGSEIKHGFSRSYDVDSNVFGEILILATNETLNQYIRCRKLYHAASDLRLKPELSISDIALEYSFSDQSAFTNAFRNEYGLTTKSARLQIINQ